MSLISCIKDLLRLEDKVVLPGLGFFSQETESASVSLGEASFNPPKLTLNFINDKYSKGDQLAEYLAHKKNIDLELAKTEVDVFIDKLRHVADHDDEFLIDGIGHFQGRNGRLRFNPEQYDKIVQAALPQFKSEPIERSKIEKTNSISNSRTAVTTKYDQDKTPIEWWRYLIGLLLIGSLAFLVWKMIAPAKERPIATVTQNYNEEGQQETTPEIKQEQQLEQPLQESNIEKEENNENLIEEKVAMEEKQTPESNLLESIIVKGDELVPRYIDGDKCAIIAAVLGDPKNVERMKKKIAALGYEVYHKPFGKVNRIGALVHCDEASVLDAIADLGEKIDKNAWLLADKK